MSKRLLHSIIVLSLFPCLSCGVETTKTDSTIPSFNSKLKSKAKNMIPSVECSDTDTLLVTLNENVKNAKETVFSTFDDNAVTDLTTSITDDCKKVYSVDLSGFSYDDINKAVSDLESKDEVYYIEKDNPIPIADSTEPDDPYYSSSQWGLNGTYGINAPNAWKFTTGSSSVRVGVIDTGVAKHTDLNANLVDGYDFVADSADGSKDLNGHGTHVAGIIGAVGNNSIGVTGVSKKTCIFCGASVSTGLMQYGTVSIASLYDEKTIYFGNGSYVLPNGIYVISDEDLDAVLNGILALPE